MAQRRWPVLDEDVVADPVWSRSLFIDEHGSAVGLIQVGPIEVQKSLMIFGKPQQQGAHSHVQRSKPCFLAERRICSAEFNPGPERAAADLALVLVGRRGIGPLSQISKAWTAHHSVARR